jgi:hypothetical protein
MRPSETFSGGRKAPLYRKHLSIMKNSITIRTPENNQYPILGWVFALYKKHFKVLDKHDIVCYKVYRS